MIDALTVLLRLFITVLPFAYLVFLVRTSWRTGSKRFLLVSTANILVCFLVWLSSWGSGVLTVWDGLVPSTALVLALVCLICLYTQGWWQTKQRRF